MCYGMNCGYESYPNGPNEGCHCRLPWHTTCPFDRPFDREQDDITDDDQRDGDDDYDGGDLK